MTDEDTLFGGYDPPVALADESLSADQRRTLRQRRDVDSGVHPLMGGPLHERADRTVKAGDPKGLPHTCGSCVHRDPHGYPSCVIGPRSHGAATDVRAWWPACPRWEAAP